MSPWGPKESDLTEQVTLSLSQNAIERDFSDGPVVKTPRF